MTRVTRGLASLLAVAMVVGAAGCGYRYPGQGATSTSTTTTTNTPPPPDKVPCLIMYGTLVPGNEKDVPVYIADSRPLVQIATIHLPGEIWSPPEAEDLCL